MEIIAGSIYFVSDGFFQKIDDPYLKINYENTKRPHYFAFKDISTSLYWLVPCSSKVEKFERIIQKKQEQHKSTDAIKMVTIQNKKSALLFQDMFPVTPRYIESRYIRGGQPVLIADQKAIQELEKTARKIITLLHKGIKFTPTQPDVNKIEKLMLAELQEKTAEMISQEKVSPEHKSKAQPAASQQDDQDEYDLEI